MLIHSQAVASRFSDTLQVGSTPRTANGSALKQVKAASKAYEALAEAFSQFNNIPKLRAQVNAGKDLWADVRPLCTNETCFA